MYTARQSLDEFNENSIECQNVGRMTHQCTACGALMFKDEHSKNSLRDGSKQTFSLCCAHGNVEIPPVKEPPDMLKALLTGRTQRYRDFRTNIRAYNSSLAFASMCLTGKEYNFKTNGPYCYRINGQVYHKVSQMLPENGNAPGFSQIYIYEKEHELDNHMNAFSTLDKSLLKDLQDMIKDINPYAQKYSHVSEVIKENPTGDIQLVLKTTREIVDLRRYNLPVGTDVAVIIHTEHNDISSRDIVIYKSASQHPTGQSLMKISTEHPMYDPLMYVLMFPYGDKGWELGCHTSKNHQSKKCSAMQFYRYRLMVHGGETFNIIHRLGRLFQQYIVDMYLKIEAERLYFL